MEHQDAFKMAIVQLLKPGPLPWYVPVMKTVKAATQEVLAGTPHKVELMLIPTVEGANLNIQVSPDSTHRILKVRVNESTATFTGYNGTEVESCLEYGVPLDEQTMKTALLTALEDAVWLIWTLNFLSDGVDN